jgi:hypothetical protein
MGYHLAVDANVFLLANSNVGCAHVYQRVMYDWDQMLVLDENNKIYKEYRRYAIKYPDSRLRQLVKEMIDRAPSNPSVQPGHFINIINLSSQINFHEYGLCNDPESAEPDYFGVTMNQPHTYFVIPHLRLNEMEKIARGYRNGLTIDELRNRFPNVSLKTTENLDWLTEPSDSAPRSINALRAYIKKNRLDKTNPERSFIEFKCPDNIEDGITDTIYRKAMEAVCAFTNSMNGYIFIGVRDDGTILGIACKYKGKHQKSWDNLWQIIGGRIGTDFPVDKKPIISAWWIPADLTGSKCVLAIRVTRQTGKPITFKSEEFPKVFLREGTTSLSQTTENKDTL